MPSGVMADMPKEARKESRRPTREGEFIEDLPESTQEIIEADTKSYYNRFQPLEFARDLPGTGHDEPEAPPSRARLARMSMPPMETS